MFTALDASTQDVRIILDAVLPNDLEDLRRLDRADQLLCPTCHKPVRVRAGEVRSWHFAHKHLANCPHANESPAIAAGKAALYPWLRAKFGRQLSMEQVLPEAMLPRPVDFWVASEKGTFAYWLIDKQLTSAVRERLVEIFEAAGARVHWVFLDTILEVSEEKNDVLYLTKTERVFMGQEKQDEPYHGGSLHYLLVAKKQVCTFRGLHEVHPPQVYRGRRLEHSLDDMLVLRSTGELVHPGEAETRRAYYERRRLEEERAEERRRAEAERLLRTQEQEREELMLLRKAYLDSSTGPSRPAGAYPTRRPERPFDKPPNEEALLRQVRRNAAKTHTPICPAPGQPTVDPAQIPRPRHTMRLQCVECGAFKQAWRIVYGYSGYGLCPDCNDPRLHAPGGEKKTDA